MKNTYLSSTDPRIVELVKAFGVDIKGVFSFTFHCEVDAVATIQTKQHFYVGQIEYEKYAQDTTEDVIEVIKRYVLVSREIEE